MKKDLIVFFFFFQAEDGIRDYKVTGFRRVLFRSPGAMNHSHLNKITRDLKASIAIIAPDGRDGMLQHARELSDLGIPFMFDPGQGLPMFSGEELLAFVDRASYVAVNDYEGRLLEERTGRKIEDLARGLEALVLTRGAEGSIIYAKGQRSDIPCAKADAVVDPTGCGDAYRAGLLYGIASRFDWQKTGKLASLMGAIKVASSGGQNHSVSRDKIGRLLRSQFGLEL